MVDDQEAVWKALADPTRRKILHLLRTGPRTTTAIVTEIPELSRFGVMKHLAVLREANLVWVRKQGASRLNSLNAVPIRLLHESLIGDFQDLWARK